MDFSKKWLKFLLHFFKKIKILRKIKIPNPTYLSSPNSLLLSILYQYTPFSQPKSSYGAKKSKNVKKRHFTPIFAPKVPHIMFFRKNVTRVFALSQKVSGGLAKFQRDLTYSFRELDFFCKKRIKGKCSFEPTGPLPLSLLNAKAGRGGHLDRSVTCGAWVLWAWFVSIGLGAISFKPCGTRRKRAPEGCSFTARMSCETVSDELCRVSQKQHDKTFCIWSVMVKKDLWHFQWLKLHLISL